MIRRASDWITGSNQWNQYYFTYVGYLRMNLEKLCDIKEAAAGGSLQNISVSLCATGNV